MGVPARSWPSGGSGVRFPVLSTPARRFRGGLTVSTQPNLAVVRWWGGGAAAGGAAAGSPQGGAGRGGRCRAGQRSVSYLEGAGSRVTTGWSKAESSGEAGEGPAASGPVPPPPCSNREIVSPLWRPEGRCPERPRVGRGERASGALIPRDRGPLPSVTSRLRTQSQGVRASSWGWGCPPSGRSARS